MKRCTFSILDRIECLLYTIKEQNNTALPAIQNANQEQVLFWKFVLSECGRKLLNIVDFYHFKRVVADSTIIEEIQIFSEDWILSFIRKPSALDFVKLRKIDADFESNLSEAIVQIGRISRGSRPVLIQYAH